MAEKILENQFCRACGADVRPNALFCYNCGSQVASDEEVAAEAQNGSKVSSAWYQDSIAEMKVTENTKSAASKAIFAAKKKSAPESTAIPFKQETNVGNEKSPTDGLKTAASIRKKPNPFLKKKVEVTWEAYDNAPNFWFLLVSIVLAIFAVAILVTMLYIR
jgi:hypothetical protein